MENRRNNVPVQRLPIQYLIQLVIAEGTTDNVAIIVV